MKKIFFPLFALFFMPLLAVAKAEPVSLSTKDGWTLAAIYSPAQAQHKTVILLHDLNKKRRIYYFFQRFGQSRYRLFGGRFARAWPQ